jgi:DNA-binding transcriptional ArsR family regulator
MAIKKQTTIPNLRTLRLLADGQRHRIVSLLAAEPLTVRELAERLDLPRTRLYYHIGLLIEHKLIRIVSTRMVAGAKEHTYQAVAEHFRVDHKVLSPAKSVRSAQAEILEHSASDLRSIAGDGLGAPVVGRTFCNLDKKSYAKLVREVHALIDKYQHANAGPDQVQITLAVFSIGPSPLRRR